MSGVKCSVSRIPRSGPEISILEVTYMTRESKSNQLSEKHRPNIRCPRLLHFTLFQLPFRLTYFLQEKSKYNKVLLLNV